MVKTIKRLALLLSGLILTGLALVPLVQVGYNKMMFGEQTANNIIYPMLGKIIQWMALIAIFVVLGICIWAIISYVRNRGKPVESSEELKAIKELLSEIKNLRQDIKDQGGCKYERYQDNPTQSKNDDIKPKS